MPLKVTLPKHVQLTPPRFEGADDVELGGGVGGNDIVRTLALFSHANPEALEGSNTAPEKIGKESKSAVNFRLKTAEGPFILPDLGPASLNLDGKEAKAPL